MIDPKELETVKQLSPEDRHAFLIDQVLETGQVWGLCGEGWASFLDDAQGIQAFPIWSEQGFAELNAVGNWEGFKAMPFTIQQLVDELVPELTQANIYLSVFKIPEDSGYLVEAESLGQKLKKKMAS